MLVVADPLALDQAIQSQWIRLRSESEYYQTCPGPTVYENGIFWCPLIGAYTGARREEIAGLAHTDILEIDGIPCFSIEDSELRRIKNISSKRLMPVHRQLIALGFLDLVKKQKAKCEVDMFPGLREPATGQHGRKLGRRMRQIIDGTLGAEGKELSFHSLRHYVQNVLEDIPDVKDKATGRLSIANACDVARSPAARGLMC